MKDCNKYKVNLYLGKELKEKLTQIAQGLSLPLSTTCRIILQSGLMIETAFENQILKGGNENAKNQNKR